MGESNKLFDLGRMKSSVGPVGRGSNSWGQVNLPKAIGGCIAAPSEDCLISVGNSHVVLGEGCNTVCITELANGEKRVVYVVEKESIGGRSRKAWDGKSSNRGGKNGSSIGERDRDGIMISGHIGKTSCGGRKEMASGACVSNGRARSYKLGRGINCWGRNGFI